MNKSNQIPKSCVTAVSGSVSLISMTDFILEQDKIPFIDYDILWSRILNYANFLKQPLKLWMFVPCDEYGNVLNEFDYLVDIEKHNDWFKAKKRCLFNGFNFQDANEDYPMPFVYLNEDVTLYTETFDKNSTVEDLVYYSDFITLSNTSNYIIGLTDSPITDR